MKWKSKNNLNKYLQKTWEGIYVLWNEIKIEMKLTEENKKQPRLNEKEQWNKKNG